MKTSLLFRVKTIGKSTRCGRKPSILLHAARHNLREIQSERGSRSHIDPKRTPKNLVLHGPATAKAVDALAQSLIQRYEVPRSKLRRDYVQALEFVISLPATSPVDSLAYFKASTAWLLQMFTDEMVLSVVVHLDEGAPHLHALVLPIVNGRYEGGAPINRSRLPELIQQFAQTVGAPFGLSFEQRVRLNSLQRGSAVTAVVEYLSSHSDPVLSSRVWPAVSNDIKRDPQGYMEILGLAAPTASRPKKMKTLAEIMTGIGKRTAEDRARRPALLPSRVGFASISHSHPSAGLSS